MWLERTGNSRFSEPQRQWALRLHTARMTLSDRLEKLTAANVIYLDKKKGKTKDGWNIRDVYTVTEPPASVLRMAQAAWDVDADRGKALPCGRNLVHDETRINTGDARGPESVHITTNSNQPLHRSVPTGVVGIGTVVIDSVGGRNLGHGEARINIDDSRGPTSVHPLTAELEDAKNKLGRLRQTVGNEAFIEVQRERIADLEARLGGTTS
jgi:hypothetical protein